MGIDTDTAFRAARANSPDRKGLSTSFNSPVPEIKAKRKALLWVYPLVSFILDIFIVNVAFAVSFELRYRFGLGGFGSSFMPVPYREWLQFELLLSLLMPVTFLASGVYRRRLGVEWINEVFTVAHAATVGMAMAIITTYLFQHLIDQHSRLVLITTWLLIIVLAAFSRALRSRLMVHLHRRGWNVRRVLVAGSTRAGKIVMQNLITRADQGYQLVGFLHENGGHSQSFGRFTDLGPVTQVADVIGQRQIDEVVIALSSASHEDIMRIRDHCVRQQVAFKIVPDLFEMSLARVRMDEIAGIPLIDVIESPLRGVNLVVKRLLDIILSVFILVVLSPLLAIVAIAIKLDSRGPIFIKQPRVGRGGHTFPFYKFRSMKNGSEVLHADMEAMIATGQPMSKNKVDPRRTRTGRVIRKLSIDELPQLMNVLRGDMSLVGPRPALPSEVERYEAWHQRRFDAFPGLTGLWQVSGRSDLDFDEMVMMDTYYIDNWSLTLDLKILLRTPMAVVMMRGAY